MLHRTLVSAPPPFAGAALKLRSGCWAEQGRRPTMEDTHEAADPTAADSGGARGAPSDASWAYYAVYDGHGGKNAADMAKKHLRRDIFARPAFQQGNIVQAIGEGFLATDQKILAAAEAGKWTDGTTVACVLCCDGKTFVANVGDAEVVLATGHEAKCLTVKHLASHSDEAARVAAAGGRIFLGRVNGTIAVSRALGDIDLKANYNKAASDYVTALPYVSSLRLQPDNPFFIVACDGLWDKVTYSEAVALCAQVRQAGGKPEQAAHTLVDEALMRGSMDNVTCIVVYINWY